MCFAIDDGQLHSFAIAKRELANPPTGIPPTGMLVLRRKLPATDQRLAGEDIAWLIRQVQLMAPTTLEEEVRRQNQETLELLATLQTFRKSIRPGESPTAA